MNARALAIVAASISLLACDAPSPTQPRLSPSDAPSQIVAGTLDGNTHRATVLVVLDVNGTPTFRCSGVMLAPTVVMTAGHCTGEPGEFSGIRIFTESDVVHGNNNYPFGGGANTIEAHDWHSHPLFTEATFFLHDVGVINLSAPFNLSAGEYGRLPVANQLDALKPGPRSGFTVVGYGDQFDNPVFSLGQPIRMYATPYLLQINTAFTGSGLLMLSNNQASGGSCFGDSGGPNYLGTSNVVAGLTSFGLSSSCGGTGGVFRLDKQDVIDFVNGFLP